MFRSSHKKTSGVNFLAVAWALARVTAEYIIDSIVYVLLCTPKNKKGLQLIVSLLFSSDPEAIRTLDLLLRSQGFMNLVYHQCPVYKVYTGHYYFQFILIYTNER